VYVDPEVPEPLHLPTPSIKIFLKAIPPAPVKVMVIPVMVIGSAPILVRVTSFTSCPEIVPPVTSNKSAGVPIPTTPA
jgi:ABC-type proline/glycine betaine transport system permease subunit